ncbi:MAG TPA: TonB family protein [Kofleriaceae bacterium]|jgi:molybdenum cofactor biosynthesis protein B
MERGFVGLDVAVLAVGDALMLADEPAAQLVVERVSLAGHRVVAQQVIADTPQLIKAKYLEWIADPEIDVVIVTAGVKSDAATETLAPMITRPIKGFVDLFRQMTYAEIGSAAMLIDVAAGQCKSTFVFVLPSSIGAVRTALEKLLMPQLDYRTKPQNLVMRMPRHHTPTGTTPDPDASAPVKTPWITAKSDGTAPRSTPPRPPPATLPPKTRAGTEPGAPPPRPELSVSQRMAAVIETASARTRPPTNPMPSPSSIPIPTTLPPPSATITPAAGDAVPTEILAKEPTNVTTPPPPPPSLQPPIVGAIPTIRSLTAPPPMRAKAPTTTAALPLKPPAQVVPLAALLTNPPVGSLVSDAPVLDAKPGEVPVVASPVAEPAVLEAPTSVTTVPGPQIVKLEELAALEAKIAAQIDAAEAETPPSGTKPAEAKRTSEPKLNGTHVALNGHATPLAAKQMPAMAPDEDVHDSDELDDDVEDAPKPPLLPPPKKKNPGMIVEDAALKTAVIEAQKRAVTQRVPALEDPTATVAAQKRAATARVTALDGFDEDEDAPPRAVAIPARRRQRQFAIVWAIIFASTAALVMLVIVYFRRQAADERILDAQRESEQHANVDTPPPAPIDNPAIAPVTPDAPDAVDAPDIDAPPIENAAVPVDAAPEIEVTPETPVAKTPVAKTPVAKTPVAKTPVAKTPTEKVTVPPELQGKPEVAAEPGCDEVSCVLDRYKLACCARFKPKDEPTLITKGASGLPEKLERSMVQTSMAKVKPTIQRCGETTSAKGTVKVNVQVGPTGGIISVDVDSSPDPALGTCVAAAVRKASFPATENGGSFTYPFVF